LVLVLLGGGRAAAQQTRAVERTVEVVDEETGEPVAGAVVWVLGRRAEGMTGGDGRVVLPALRVAGEDTLVVRRIGYAGFREAVRLGAGEVVRVRLRAEPLALDSLRVSQTGTTILQLPITSCRLVAIGMSPFSSLYNSGARNALELVEDRVGYRRVSCTIGGNGRPRYCSRFRGISLPVVVWVDDRRSGRGLDELADYDVRDVSRIEIAENGQVLHLHTRAAAELEQQALASTAGTTPGTRPDAPQAAPW
jgi:hypothetical protein